MSPARQELLGRLERLRALMQAEGGLKGAELERAVKEKEALVLEVEGLWKQAQGEGGADQELAAAAQAAKWAAGYSAKGSRLRKSLAQAGRSKGGPTGPSKRIDVIS